MNQEKMKQAECMQYMTDRIAKRKSDISALTGNNRKFWDKIVKVQKIDIRYYEIKWGQLELVKKLSGNDCINACYATFCYGFHQGMQYMKNQIKRNNSQGMQSNCSMHL